MRETQHSKIIKMLKASKWGVPNYKFPQAGILRYSARIDELRKDGYNIYIERERVAGRSSNVYRYFLIEDKPTPKAVNKAMEYEL